jgi:hypothetical protein
MVVKPFFSLLFLLFYATLDTSCPLHLGVTPFTLTFFPQLILSVSLDCVSRENNFYFFSDKCFGSSSNDFAKNPWGLLFLFAPFDLSSYHLASLVLFWPSPPIVFLLSLPVGLLILCLSSCPPFWHLSFSFTSRHHLYPLWLLGYLFSYLLSL